MTDDRPHPSPAAVCQVRLRYAKRGKLRFASHRDLTRTFERAVRKASLPVAHSQGYTPHPRISWIGAAPTGTESEAEYVELGLTERVEPGEVLEALATALPTGMVVLDGVLAGSTNLAAQMQASHWRIRIPDSSAARLRPEVDALLAAEQVLVPRRTKSGTKEIDVRAACLSVAVADSADVPEAPTHPRSCSSARRSWPEGAGEVGQDSAEGIANAPGYGILEVVVRQMTPTVRPDDVLRALRVVGGQEWSGSLTRATRVAQGSLDDGGRIVDPLAADKAEASADRWQRPGG